MLMPAVVTAVWHGDPQREQLLRDHVANLARQTIPVEAIYVFDGGDLPPPWLKARAVCVKEPLTIYQAWNVGLSLVGASVVMNLNLDDRLAPNAVEVMQRALLGSDAVAIGGDWKVCYSQRDTDNVQPVYPATRLPFVRAWPPPQGALTRLGSGTGDRGTYGPATMWRTSLHLSLPRFPWRAADGTLLRVVGDQAWWILITEHLQQKILRLPLVVGNYYSHPSGQAEFRSGDESKLLVNPGISLM